MDVEKHSSSEKSSEDHDRSKSEAEDTAFAPIAAPNEREDRLGVQISKQRSNASRSLDRVWSLNDGVSVNRQDVEETVQSRDQTADAGDEFTVGWDENDPMNPRSMSLARRWLITILVSSGSVCV